MPHIKVGQEFERIDITPLWKNLNMDDELDDDTLFIELHCLLISTSKFRFTRETKIDEAQYVDDTVEEGRQYIHKRYHPGPRPANWIHPNEVRINSIVEGYSKLAQKYGQKHFDDFLRNLYTSYPTPDPNISVIEYLNSLKEGRPQFHFKWSYIYDFMHSISRYFEIRGETL